MRQTAETQMLSVILNTGNPGIAAALGIRPEHFTGFRDEYEWVNKYYQEYGCVPTADQLNSKFPGLPRLDQVLTDPRHPAQEMGRDYARKTLMRAITDASTDLERDDVEEAYRRIQGLTLESFTPPPENLLASGTFFDDYDHEPATVAYPWATLQRKTGGIAPEQLAYIAARPSQGKSWLLVNIAAAAAYAGHRVLFYSLEMSKRELQVRSHAVLGNKLGWGSNINTFDMLHRKFSKDDYRLLLMELDEKTQGTLHIQDQSQGRVTPATIASRASEYDLTIIDYVGLMGTDRGAKSVDDWRAAAEISNELKGITKSKKTRVLAAAQINRSGDAEGKPVPPKMKDLAGTDAYVQDADQLVTMTRIRGGHAAALSLEKNRAGDSDVKFYIKFLANQGDFSEVTRQDAEDICDEYDD